MRLWEKEIMADEEEVDLDGNVGEEGVRVEVSEEDAIVELCFGNRVNWVVGWVFGSLKFNQNGYG